MSNRDDFIAIIDALKIASPTITDEQRKGFLRLGVQQHGLTIDEATYILNAAGLTIGEQINYFEVLGFSIDELQSLDELAIVNHVEVAHKKLYTASLRAGGRPRVDGRTEEQWRTLLNQAREVLIDVEKRQEYIALLQNGAVPSNESISEIENTPSEQTQSVSVEQHTPSIPLEKDDMVLIPAGEFQMGSDERDAFNDEKPIHTVYVDAFYMDKYPVTNAQFKAFIDENPQWRKPLKWYESGKIDTANILREFHDGEYLKNWNKNDYPRGEDQHPATWVSWYAAMAYSQWMGKRLPTEAEWEKAARGGLIGEKYPWGSTIDASYLNYDAYIGKTTTVGKYPPNNYGLYDMIGNVYEWCLDAWNKNFYMQSPRDNPFSGDSIVQTVNNFTDIRSFRIMRGGSCVSIPQNVRVAYRSRNTPKYTCFSIGFRCVMPV